MRIDLDIPKFNRILFKVILPLKIGEQGKYQGRKNSRVTVRETSFTPVKTFLKGNFREWGF